MVFPCPSEHRTLDIVSSFNEYFGLRSSSTGKIFFREAQIPPISTSQKLSKTLSRLIHVVIAAILPIETEFVVFYPPNLFTLE
jgi:hypothetical protein